MDSKEAMIDVVRLKVEGMMCQNSCGTTVANALSAIDGVLRAEASFANGSATAWTDGRVDVDVLVDAVEAVGFDATLWRKDLGATKREDSSIVLNIFDEHGKSSEDAVPENLDELFPTQTIGVAAGDVRALFKVEGMSCASCSGKIERTMAKTDGVRSAKVALLAAQAEIVFDPSATNADELADVMNGLGFQARCVRKSNVAKPGDSAAPKSTSFYFRLDAGRTKRAVLRRVRDVLNAYAGVRDVEWDNTSTDEVLLRVELEPRPISKDDDDDDSIRGPRDVRDLLRDRCDLAEVAVADEPNGVGSSTNDAETRRWRSRLIFAISFSIPMLIVHVFMSSTDALMGLAFSQVTWHTLLELMLSIPVQFGVGWRFYVAAARSVKHCSQK